MKKLFFGIAAMACAAAMVSCGGGSSSSKIVEGDKSKLDTLSYALGTNIGFGIAGDIPEMKFDVDALTGSAEKAMFGKGQKHEDAVKVLEDFFMNVRPQRLRSLANPADTTAKLPDPSEMDIFESDAERSSVSKAYGTDMGTNLRKSRLPIQTYWLLKGFRDAYSGGETEITQDEAAMSMQTYFMVVRPAENDKESKEWLASVEKKSGVQKTESGLLYRIDREGDNDVKPTKETDVVTVDYEGKFRDGTVFDSSYERGEPAEFPLNRVIKGWTEGMQLIGKGGQITLWIPSELAYGTYGSSSIGPNEALEFKVELHDVKISDAPAPAAAPAEKADSSKVEEDAAFQKVG